MFRQIRALNKISKLFTASWRKFHIELEPLEIQNDETSSVFLKRGEYIKIEKLLLKLSDIEFFFGIERILSKTFRSEKLFSKKLSHCVKSVRIRSYSGPYFPAFRLNIQSECGKIWTRITLNTDTFHAVSVSLVLTFII